MRDNLVDLLRGNADAEPDAPALRFPASGAALSRADWDTGARRVATRLRPGTRVVLLLPPGPDFFTAFAGVLYAGACAVPVHPPVHGQTRWLDVARDAEAEAVLTNATCEHTVREHWHGTVITVEELGPCDWVATPLDADDLALLQYTSGSTGTPKGVAVTHRQLRAWVDGFADRVDLPGGAVVSWAPVHHALGLTVALMAAPMNGTAVILNPEDVLADPLHWLGTISATSQPTFSGAIPLGYQHCVDRVPQERRDGLDLSRWEVALIGSERIRPEVLDAFTEAYAPHGFRRGAFFPSYGMTETMMAAGHRGPAEPLVLTVDAAALERGTVAEPRGERTIGLVGSGPACHDVTLEVVDPDTRERCPQGTVGELWVRGPVVAQGYWRRPELTEEVFGARLADGSGPFLRTGDLSFLHEGELVVCGRLDDLVIVRGRNLHPQDIELTALRHGDVRCAAAFSVDGHGGEELVVVAETENATHDLADALRCAVAADHDVEPGHVLLLPPGTIPLTSTGKVQRSSARRLHLSGALNPLVAVAAGDAPDTSLRSPADLSGRVAALLGRDDVPDDVPLVELGLDSLRMMTLRGELAAVGVAVPLAELSGLTIREIAIEPVNVPCGPKLDPDPDGRFEPFGLTDLQHAYLAGRSGDYPLGGVGTHFYGEFAGEVDVPRLHEALRRVVDRHDMLRAVVSADGTQRVQEQVEVPLTIEDRAPEDVRAEMSHRVFQPGEWPLFDVRVSRDRVHVSLDLLVLDLWSLRIFSREWEAFYRDPDAELPPLTATFRDYVRAIPEPTEASARYWRERDLPPGPELPLRQAPAALTRPPRFVRREARLDAAEWRELSASASRSGLTPTSVLIAAYAAVLGRWSRRSRFTLNLPTFNRLPLHPGIDDVIGDFTSVTLLEIDLTDARTLGQLAEKVQRQLLEDLEHRDFGGVRVLREMARTDVFAPVVFASSGGYDTPTAPLTWLGEMVHGISQTPQVLLDHQVAEDGDGLAFNWDSVDGLFCDGVLDAMMETYRGLLTAGLSASLPTGTPMAANDTDGPLPSGLLHDGILRQDPERVAVIAPDRTLTFGELTACAAAVAESLDVKPNELVGVALPKSAAQIVAALGVLLAGGAYLPIDPDLPEARQQKLISKGRCRTVIREVDLDARAPLSAREASPGDLAYVIFTSGSTGEPKGVAVSHRAALNTCVDVNERFGIEPDDRVLGISSLSFDLSVWDVFGLLGTGGAVVLPRSARDPEEWRDLVREHGITVWNSVPALAEMLFGAGGAPLRLVMMSGDWIPVSLPDRIRALAPDCRVVSLGGATEAAIWSICYEIGEVDPEWESIPYGTPMRNQRFHVFNDRLDECPVHVVGELYIGGAGVAEGYFGDPDRTHAQFIQHHGERLYRTGDLGRWRADGTIEFLGREDFQVKIGGYRIELGEVEAALNRHPSVEGAVVVAVGDRHHQRLVAYVRGSVPDDYLPSVLPAYMVPSAIVEIDEFPLSANGKVDRSALPDPLAAASGEADTELAEQVRDRVAALLRVDSVPTTVALPALGMDSLRVIELRNVLKQDFGAVLPVRTLLGTKVTITDIAVALAAELGTPDGLPEVVAGPRYEPFDLTDLQQAYFVGRSGGFALGGVSTYFYAEWAGELDPDRLISSFRQLVRRHDMLRAVVTSDGRQQVLEDAPDAPVTVYRGDAELERVREEMAHQVLPLDTWPLFDLRLTVFEDRVHVHFGCDMLIADVWSVGVLLREWEALYDGSADLPELTLTFRDYLTAASRIPCPAQDREYWLSRVDGLPAGPELPLVAAPDTITEPHFTRRSTRIGPAKWSALKDAAARRGLTPNAVLLAAFATTLGGWTRGSRFLLNLPTFNRHPLHPQVGDIIGDFTSVTLLEADLSGPGGIVGLAERLHARLVEDLEHRAFSGIDVLRALPRGTMAPVVFTSAIGQARDERGDLPVRWLGEQVHGISQTPQVLLDHQTYEDSGALVVHWDCVEEIFAPDVVADMFDAYCAVLERLSVGDDGWLGELPSLPPTTHRDLVALANDTAGPVPEGLLHSRLLASDPDAPAVITAAETLTFGRLVGRASALAETLRELGVRPGQLVGVAYPKCGAQIVAALGVLLAGGAYLPIDPELPVARQDKLLASGRCRVVVGERDDWPAWVEAVAVGADEAPVPDQVAGPGDLAYVIFTSGSTGEPKGVAVSHRAALNTCVDVNERFGIGPDDRVLGLSSLSFDLSVWDVFGVLGAGGAVVLPTASRDPAQWWDLVREHGVTVWNSVPALAQMFVEHVTEPVPLRLVMMSGDWIPVSLPDRLRALAPDCRVVSLGGATEAAIWSICYEIGEVDPAWESIPYGTPMRNQRFHVFNERLDECPVHVVGELHIAGEGLAEGYFGDPDRTAARFVKHPETGERLYRTGDLGRWRPDGTIEFLGREDFQVKIGGYRIELGEVEAALTSHPAVRDAVVTAVGDRHHRRLAGCVVGTAGGPTAVAGVDPAYFSESDRAVVLFDHDARVEFKLARHGVRTDLAARQVILPAVETEPVRTSRRRYADRPVELNALASLLEPLRSHTGGAMPKYRYGSAGNAYAVQTYVDVLRVNGLQPGSYYYDPAEHRLLPTGPRPGPDVQLGVDQQTADTAAFTLYFVADLDAVRPLYGVRSRDVCLIETGLICQLLEDTAQHIGLCQVRVLGGDLTRAFSLHSGHEVLHGMVGGALLAAGEEPAVAAPRVDDLLESVREHISGLLPEYMVPAQLAVTGSLPLTPTGKVDRAALERLAAATPEVDAIPPAGGLETRIAEVFGRVLGVETVGAGTGFFDLGADSVAVVKAHRLLQEELRRKFPLTAMFEHASVRRLATALSTEDTTDLLAEAATRAERAKARRRKRGVRS